MVDEIGKTLGRVLSSLVRKAGRIDSIESNRILVFDRDANGFSPLKEASVIRVCCLCQRRLQ